MSTVMHFKGPCGYFSCALVQLGAAVSFAFSCSGAPHQATFTSLTMASATLEPGEGLSSESVGDTLGACCPPPPPASPRLVLYRHGECVVKLSECVVPHSPRPVGPSVCALTCFSPRAGWATKLSPRDDSVLSTPPALTFLPKKVLEQIHSWCARATSAVCHRSSLLRAGRR